MKPSEYAIGQAVYVRTDTPDYEEVTVPFQSLGELVKICSQPRPELLLDKVVIYATVDEEPRSVSLSFLSASKGSRPGNLDELRAED
jgi:hypothetical protein